jgi:hypothetical protein
MKKTLITAAFLFASSIAVAQDGLTPLGYPGSTWSVLTVNPGVIKNTPEDDNVLLQGKIEQGIDWRKLGDNKEWTLNTYVSLGYSADKNGLSYNNKVVPAVGVKMSRSFDSGVFDVGLQAVHENHFRGVTSGPSRGTGMQLYASYWFGWNLGR